MGQTCRTCVAGKVTYVGEPEEASGKRRAFKHGQAQGNIETTLCTGKEEEHAKQGQWMIMKQLSISATAIVYLQTLIW